MHFHVIQGSIHKCMILEIIHRKIRGIDHSCHDKRAKFNKLKHANCWLYGGNMVCLMFSCNPWVIGVPGVVPGVLIGLTGVPHAKSNSKTLSKLIYSLHCLCKQSMHTWIFLHMQVLQHKKNPKRNYCKMCCLQVFVGVHLGITCEHDN